MSTAQARSARNHQAKPTAPDLAFDKGLPSNPDAERFVLGSIMLNDAVYPQVARVIDTEDFSLEKHRRIYRCMKAIHSRSEHVDRIVLTDEIIKHGWLDSVDGFSYLISLDEGLPEISNLNGYVRIVRDKSTLRKMIFKAQKIINRGLLAEEEPGSILDTAADDIAELRCGFTAADSRIRAVEDLESVFLNAKPMKYLVEPILAEGQITLFIGESGSGKTTLTFALARQLIAEGHAVLYIDRDHNPRHVIQDRMKRLGMEDHPLLKIWDYGQIEEPPDLNDPRCVDYVKSMLDKTGKPVFVTGDSLVKFFRGEESENDSKDMRRVIDRGRVLTALGASVLYLHHPGKDGNGGRGSSDLRPAIDNGYIVRNSGVSVLDLISLGYYKDRLCSADTITYRYDGGDMNRVDGGITLVKTIEERLVDLIKVHPGVTNMEFRNLAKVAGLGFNRAGEFLNGRMKSGEIRTEGTGTGSSPRRHWWRSETTERQASF